MPQKKKKETIVDKIKKNSWREVWADLRLGESYTSLLLGLLVVVVVAGITVTYIKSKATTPAPSIQEVSSDKTQNTVVQKTENTYTVTEGESLWSIAEKKYNSGYKWVDIVKANNIPNPDVVEAGTKITLPLLAQATQTAPTATPTIAQQQDKQQVSQGEKITGATYTVQRGDFLWDIAVRAYGDGYRWTDIAKANGLENPDMIFSENVLKLPR